MMYRRKAYPPVSAVQWWKSGDHPGDRQTQDKVAADSYDEGRVVRDYHHPRDSGDRLCEHCGLKMHVHGWIDWPTKSPGGYLVCPGDWVLYLDGRHLPMKPTEFAACYEQEAVHV